MEEERLSTDQKDYIRKIIFVADQASEMIQKLLDLDTIQNNKREIVLEEIDPVAELQNLIDNYSKQAEQKDIEIHFSFFTLNGFFRTDKQHFIRICDNLLSNAIKFSPHRRDIYVKVLEKMDRLILEFIDEGKGISDKDKPYLFKKFQRLTSQPTGGENSSGLGLAIVKALVEDLDGTINYVNEPEKGANFTVILPKKEID